MCSFYEKVSQNPRIKWIEQDRRGGNFHYDIHHRDNDRYNQNTLQWDSQRKPLNGFRASTDYFALGYHQCDSTGVCRPKTHQLPICRVLGNLKSTWTGTAFTRIDLSCWNGRSVSTSTPTCQQGRMHSRPGLSLWLSRRAISRVKRCLPVCVSPAHNCNCSRNGRDEKKPQGKSFGEAQMRPKWNATVNRKCEKERQKPQQRGQTPPERHPRFVLILERFL